MTLTDGYHFRADYPATFPYREGTHPFEIIGYLAKPGAAGERTKASEEAT
jgi:hypothetical protein